MKGRPILDWSDDGELDELEELLANRAHVKITAERDGSFTIGFEIKLEAPDWTILERAAGHADTAAGPLVRRACQRAVQSLLDTERARRGRRRPLD